MSERMAHHLAQAGEAERAIEMWQRASKIAVVRAAYQEGLDHLNRGLEQLHELPESTERLRIELELQSAAGPLVQTLFGWASNEAIECYDRAEQLCRQLGDDEKLFPVLWGYWALFRGQQQPAKAREIVDELFRLARERDDEALLLEAHHAAWGQPFKGDLTNQLRHIEQALSIYDPDKHAQLAVTYGNHDAGVCALFHQSVVLWSMGFPDRARQSGAKAKDLTLKISHPPTSVQMQHVSSLLCFLAGDAATAYHEASRSIEISREHGLLNFVPISLSLQSWARCLAEGSADSVAELERVIEDQHDSRRPGMRATTHAMYAEAVGRIRSAEEGLALIEQSLSMIEEHEERLWKANTYTLRGEFLLQLGSDRSDEAEAAFHEAIAVAHEQKARMWELRAATHLGDLWHSQGRTEDARDLLAPIYAWFTEGFDTIDLKAAKALLDELN